MWQAHKRKKARTHASKQASTRTPKHKHTHTHAHTHTHTHTTRAFAHSTNTHARTHSRTHARTKALARARAHRPWKRNQSSADSAAGTTRRKAAGSAPNPPLSSKWRHMWCRSDRNRRRRRTGIARPYLTLTPPTCTGARGRTGRGWAGGGRAWPGLDDGVTASSYRRRCAGFGQHATPICP